MFKIFNQIKNIKESANVQSNSIWEEPKMSVAKWYELQHKLREAQMAQARAGK
ncbi:MAG: hypothetical protein K2I23_03305 [Clostridia bacterium]|nr:hypothetical protein [Clostridia bacterium]